MTGMPIGAQHGVGGIGRSQVGQAHAESIELSDPLEEHFEESGIVG
jgi:hypothetical protein